MIQGGYILLARKTLESELFDKPPLWSKLWNWMLLRAEWRDDAKLARGQFWTNLEAMREAMSWHVGYRKMMPTVKETRSAYEGLREGEMIGVAKGIHGVLITILNYEKYQSPENYERRDEGRDEKTTKGDARARYSKEVQEEKKKERQYVSEDRDVSCSPSGATHARAKKRPPCPHVEIVAAYHELLPQLPTVQAFGDSAKKTLQARWNERPENQTLEFWRDLFRSVSASDFLMGRSKDWQCPGLLWIIGPKNFAKILNGHYQNHGPSTGSALTDANTRAAQAWLSEGVKQ